MERFVTVLALLTGLAFVLVAARKPADPAVERTGVMQADRDFNDAAAARGIEGWLAFFAADGRQIGPGEVVQGFPAIREYMGPFFADGTRRLNWSPDDAMVSQDGTLAFTTGRYTSTFRDSTGAEHPRGQGRYVTIWRREKDNSWKVVLDIGNPDPPAGP